ncbi:MAG: hypothetical protein ABIJ92_05030 [Candidatus Aenigmatarchaeota archaeon]
MKIILLIACLVVVVSISGCTSPVCIPFLGDCDVTSDTDDVIIIRSLEAIPSTITSGQQTRIIAHIQNVGDKSIQDVVKSINQSDVKTRSDGVALNGIEIKLFDYCEGLFTIDVINCPGDKGFDNKKGCVIEDLFPQEIKQVDWILTAGDVAFTTTCPKQGMGVYVRYPYKTEGFSTIAFIHSEELQRQIEQGTYTKLESETVVGAGPVKAVLIVEDQQPVAASISDKKATTTVSLQMRNAGGGFPVSFSKTGETDSGKDKIHIRKAWYDVDLKGLADSNNECAFDGPEKRDIKLIDRESTKLLCEANVLPDSKVTKETTRTMTVDVSYQYEFGKKVKVTVEAPGF